MKSKNIKTEDISTKRLQDFFEQEDFNVHLFEQDGEQYAEVEKWTDGGVDMIFSLQPFTKKSFIDRVENFDIDEEIDLHRQGQDYKNAFTITQSVEDFTNFHNDLKEVASKLEQL